MNAQIDTAIKRAPGLLVRRRNHRNSHRRIVHYSGSECSSFSQQEHIANAFSFLVPIGHW